MGKLYLLPTVKSGQVRQVPAERASDRRNNAVHCRSVAALLLGAYRQHGRVRTRRPRRDASVGGPASRRKPRAKRRDHTAPSVAVPSATPAQLVKRPSPTNKAPLPPLPPPHLARCKTVVCVRRFVVVVVVFTRFEKTSSHAHDAFTLRPVAAWVPISRQHCMPLRAAMTSVLHRSYI